MWARGGDLMPETIPTVGLLIVRSDRGVGTFDLGQQKPGIDSWYQFRSGYQVRSSRLSESHAVGERYEVFICFNCHNLIL